MKSRSTSAPEIAPVAPTFSAQPEKTQKTSSSRNYPLLSEHFDNSHLYYMDTWGNEVQVRSRIPTKLLETVNAFMNQQKPTRAISSIQLMDVPRQQECSCGSCVNELARRLCSGSLFTNAMQPFVESSLLRIQQAKVLFDFVSEA